MKWVALAGAAGALVLAAPATTLQRTIVDRNGDGRLERGPGEAYLVRTELAPAQAGRESRRRSLVFFAQTTDVHIIDEESPARVEFIDEFGESFISAYRPYDGLLPFVAAEMARALRAVRSPLTRRGLDLVVNTGDAADNAQLNEARTAIDVLDGGRVNPDSGRRGTCLRRRGRHRYDGVRGGGRYYEPDRSGSVDGPGYRPPRVRDFPRLLEAMNRPFRSPGVGVRWYAVLGNHDVGVQGNVSDPGRIAFFSGLAVACLKPIALSERALTAIRPLLAGGVTGAERAQISAFVIGDVISTLQFPKDARGLFRLVPRDPARKLLSRRQVIAQYFRTRGRPVGHGFTAENRASGRGYYAFSPKPGLRFVVLDSPAPGLGDAGIVDDAQFRWLHGELAAAEARREIAVVFAHHSLTSMHQRGESGGHYGTGPEGEVLPCATLGAAAPAGADETVRCLLLRHPSVVAFVAGHSHRNRVDPVARPGGGGFWQVLSAGDVDFPQQARLLELFDNGDGTLSLVSTILDHASPARPSPVLPRGNGMLNARQVARLAAIARELAYDDPQAEADRPGTRADRNVELLLPSPYA